MLESVSFDDAKEISSPKQENESQLQSVSFEDAQAIANPRNRNPLEVGEDAVRQLAISANNGLSMLVSYQAPDSPIVKYLDESNQRLQSGISDPTKQVLANANAKTVDAEKRGEVESFLTTLPEYIGQPALVQKFILENILGFVGPLAAGKAVQAASVWMKLFQGAGSAAKAADLGHAATAATGAIATGGDAYSDAYKQNKVYAVTELGMNEEDADAYALEQGKAARGIGTAIGAVSAGTGIEGRAFQGAAKGGIGSKIVAPVAKDMTGELAEEMAPPIATNLQTDQNWNKGLGQIAAQTIVGGSHASVGSAIVGANDYYKETVDEAPLGAPVTLPSKVMEASTVDEVISAAMEAVTPQSQPENNYATDEELIDQAAALQQPAIEPQQSVAPIQEPVIQPAPIATAPVVNQPAVDPVPSPVSQTPSLDPVQPAAPLLQPEKKVALQTEEPVLTKVEPAIQEAALKAESAASPVAPVTENIALPIAQATTKENIAQTAPTTEISPAPAGLSENIAPVIAPVKKDTIPEANTGPSPEVLREESVSRITEFLNKKAGKVFQLLHARGKSGKTGGVVVAHDMEHAAELYAKATGKTLDEAKIHLLGDAKAVDNGEIQGFFDPETKTTYLLANNLDEKSAPAVLHHELTHAVATPELLDQAEGLLNSKPSNKNLQAFIKKVQKRRKDAGEENNREETASYIVEEALLHGKKDGFSKIDNTLFAHIADAFGKQTGEFVRSWVAKARAHLFTKGVVTKLTVDDMLALVQARAAKAAQEETTSEKAPKDSNKFTLERVPEELYKEEPKVSKTKDQIDALKKKKPKEAGSKEKPQSSILKSTKEKLSNPTIEVDGIARPRLNSNGKLIAANDAALINFWKWFGESEVVDEQGRPQLTYHGTPTGGFDSFDTDRTGKNIDSGFLSKGFYFTDSAGTADYYATSSSQETPTIMPVYLSLSNPFMWGKKTQGIRGLIMRGDDLPADLSEALSKRTGFKFDPTAEIDFSNETKLSQALQEELVARGYDGVISEFKNGQHEYVAFNPNQIKSATGNNGDFSNSANSILRSIKKKPELYSQLFKVLSNAPEKLFTTGAQVKLWLAANAGKNEIKKDEIYWSGINEWLDIQDKISKTDVLSFLDQAGVQVEEVLLGGEGAEVTREAAKKRIREMSLEIQALAEKHHNFGYKNSLEAAVDLLSGDPQNEDRSVPFALQDQIKSYVAEFKELNNQRPKLTRHGGSSSLSLPGGENYGELILTSPASERWNESDVTHFGSEGQGKAIGWIRFNSRKDQDGNKVLFLEEVQSQRSQAGRTQGFRSNSAAIYTAKQVSEGEFSVKLNGINVGVYLGATEEAAIKAAKENSSLSGTPPAPFVADASNKATNAYIGLLLKKAILYAIDTGHKAISWTTGNDQAERYGLHPEGNHPIAYIDYRGIDADHWFIEGVYDYSGNELFAGETGMNQEALIDLLGRDLAFAVAEDRGQPDAEFGGARLHTGAGEPVRLYPNRKPKEIWTSKMYGDEAGLTQDGKPALITQAANEIARKIGSLPVDKKELLSPVWQVVTNLGQVLSSFVKKEDADIVASNFRAPKSIWDTAEEDSLTKASVSVEPGMEVSFYPAIALTDAAVDKVKREGMPLFSKKASKAIRRVAPVSPQGQVRGNRQEDNADTAPETRANPGEIAGPNAPIDSGHPLGSFVNIFTRNQLVKMYQDSPIGNLLKEYKRLREQTAADENHLYSEADDFLGQLRALPKSQRDKFATLAHEATLSGIDPSAEEYTPSANSEELQKFVDSMKDVEKKSEAQAKLLVDIETRLAGKEAKYDELRAKFKALPEKSQELFVGLRDQYKKSSTLLFTEAKNRIGRMRDIDAASRADAIEKLDKELKLLLSRVYFPLFRSGNHVVIATKPGEPKIVSYFETAKKADKEDKLLTSEGYTVTRDLRVVSGHAAKTGEALGKVIAQIDKAAASGSIEGQQLTALLDDINQTIIKSLPDQSFRKSFTHRKGTAGYSNDFIRAYADSMRRSASHIANLKHSDEIQRNIAAMRDKIVKQAPGSKKQALTEVVNRVEQIEKEITIPTGKLASLAGRIGFTQMLGSLSNFGLNLTQTPLNTFPHLGAEYGFTKAALQLTSTMGKQIAVMKKPKSIREFSKFLDMRHALSGTELAIFEQLHDAKKLDLTQAFDLIEAATNASENINDTWLNFMKFVALPQHTSEVINRQVTALATIRLEMARSGNPVKAYEAAKKAIDETHFDYSKDNRANIMTGNWLRVVTMFKQYAQNQMFLWGHTANLALTGSEDKDSEGEKLSKSNKNTSERNKARKQLAAMFAAQMVAAGLLGLPVFSESAVIAAGVAGFKLKGEKGAYLGLGAGLLAVLASSFGDDDEEDFDTLVRNWLAETFGENLGEVISRGALPRGAASRLDGSEMVIRKPKPNENPYDYVADWAKALMGAFIGGTMINAGVGTAQILNEDIKGGVDKIIPLKQVKDMLQAYNWVKDDLKIKNTKGETITEVSPMDVFWKALGINPSVAVKAREYDNAVRQLDAALTAKKQKTLKRLVQDLKDDPEQVAEEILAYNSEAPIGYKLTSSTIASEFRKEVLKDSKLAGTPADPKKKLTLEEKIKFYTPPPLTKE